MGRRNPLGGLLALTAAAAAVAGVAYLFKEEIRETEVYKDLNAKYDVDGKIKTYSEKAKDTAYDLKDKAKVAAKDIKAKADEWKAAQDDDIFEDDEIILDSFDTAFTTEFNGEDVAGERDYVSIKDGAEDKVEEIKEATADKAEEIKDAAADKAEEIKDAVADKAEEVKDAVTDKAEEVKDAVADKAEDVKDAATDKAEEVKDVAADKVEEVKDAADKKD